MSVSNPRSASSREGATDPPAPSAAEPRTVMLGGSGIRRAVLPDPLYGEVRVAGWAAALLETAPFQRLAGVSLSDVPGELLFGRPFPSRLDHACGVYHLARIARPRDRLLQAAALAHDLGHGPFGHVCEPLMREWLGRDHEQRAAQRLAAVRMALPASAQRHMAWLDWDEVAALVVGAGADGRGALLNGRLDYDNMDNVARFLVAAGLGEPGYAPETLARALRLMPASPVREGDAADARNSEAPNEPTYLMAQAEAEALAWQAARVTTYGYLHGEHRNLAPHAMLRKSVELAFAQHALPSSFLDMTDTQALACLCESGHRGAAELAERVRAGSEHRHACVWEAEVPQSAAARGLLGDWRARLRLEADLAAEAGLAPQAVIVEVLVSRAGRTLPPLSPAGRPGTFTWLPAPLPAPRLLHLFVAAGTPRDYARRLQAAAQRRLGAVGVIGRGGDESEW